MIDISQLPAEAVRAATDALDEWQTSREDHDELWQHPEKQVRIVLEAFLASGETGTEGEGSGELTRAMMGDYRTMRRSVTRWPDGWTLTGPLREEQPVKSEVTE